MKILLVDDDIRFAEDCVRTLLQNKHSAAFAPDAMSARRRMAESEFDMIVIDLMLPPSFGVEGLDLLKFIKMKDTNTPVIMITSKAEKTTNIVAEAMKVGATEFIDKDDASFTDRLLTAISETGRQRTIEAESGAPAETDPDLHRRFMEMAIAEARKSKREDGRVHPWVGAVVVKKGVVLAKAYRGELSSGDHAEFTALEKKLPDEAIAGATIYTTLEPCTTRKHPKVPCARRLSERKVSRVVIGMLDPNPNICGKGLRELRNANIGVDLFDDDLKAQIEEMNRDFIRYHTSTGAGHDGEKACSPARPGSEVELSPIERACRAACGCATEVHELRDVWDCQIDAPEEFAHFMGIAATVLRLVYHVKRSKELFPPVANLVRAVRPEPPAPLLGVPPGASYHDMAIKKAEEALWYFAPDAHCGQEVLDLISSAEPLVPPAELRRLFNDESSGSLRDRITKNLQEARRVPFLWDQLCKSMQRIENFNAVALVAAIEHEAALALAKGASGRQLPA